MKYKIVLLLMIFLHVVVSMHAQSVLSNTAIGGQFLENQSVPEYQDISISFERERYGSPFTFVTEAPVGTQAWSVNISDVFGNTIFEDEGGQWNNEGYVWMPKESAYLQSGIYYIFSVSFFSEEETLRTQAIRFVTRIQIYNNRSPHLFFRGNTTDYSTELYEPDVGISQILDFIAEVANGNLRDMRLLLRGHATFVEDSIEARRDEYYELLDLSQQRALKILRELANRGIETSRMSYEALGGSEEITTVASERWKNRRVEVVFLSPEQYQIYRGNTAAREENNTQRSPRDSQNNVGDQTALNIERDMPNEKIVEDNSGVLNYSDNSTKPPSENNQRSFQDAIREDEQTFLPEENQNNSIDSNVLPLRDKIFNLTQDDDLTTPWPDLPILGDGQLTANEMLAFLLYNSPGLNREYAGRIVSFYVVESRRERINHDIAFAQMLLETDYLQFRGVIRKVQYNFAGIGTVDNNNEGNWFTTERIGVRAHVQHLKGYATTQSLTGDLVDPTYAILERYGLLGSAPLVDSLSGRWATDPEYGIKIRKILRRMYNFANAWLESQ